MAIEIKEARLIDARPLVGAKQDVLQGAGPDDFFSIELSGPVGTAVGGVQGDAMLVQQVRSLYVATFTFLGACSGVDLLLDLSEAGAAFLFSVTYNDFSLKGAANVMDVGAWVASAGNNTRTMTLNIVKISGNTNKSIGRTVTV